MRLITLTSFASSLFIIILFNSCECQDSERYYPIPNPFNKKINGYYYISSFQAAISADDGQRHSSDVEEFFSLNDGISFSIHQKHTANSKAFVLINDGSNDKSYIIRNPYSERVECELDHLYHHQHIYPWQYAYESSKESKKEDDKDRHDQNQDKRKKNIRKKTQSTSKRYIYGVGGIWLNAIERKINSSEVGDNSPLESSNRWSMNQGDLDITLLFDKPDLNKTTGDMNELIANSVLYSIRMVRKHSIFNQWGGSSSVTEAVDNILIKKLQFDVDEDDDDAKLKRLRNMLSICRQHTLGRRVFPSLIRAVSLSSKRLYVIEYLDRKYPRYYQDPFSAREAENEQRVNGFHAEWFSFKTEAQLTMNEVIPNLNEVMLEGDYSVDYFLTRFTESSTNPHSSTVHYHYIEREGRTESCRVNEPEVELIDHMMVRQVNFHRLDSSVVKGYLTGLGALIMNAADSNRKEFFIYTDEIEVAYDQTNLNAKARKIADVWQFYNYNKSRRYHFYFSSNNYSVNKYDDEDTSNNNDIFDLIRIDVRDNKAKSESIDDTEFDLIQRFDILNILTETASEEMKLMFSVPDICHEKPINVITPSDSSDDDSDDDDSVNDQPFHYDSSSDDEKTPTDDHQADDEDFEPGKVAEESLPDFFEFLDGQSSFEVTSKIELSAPGSDLKLDSNASGHIFLVESTDLQEETTRLRIFFSDSTYASMEADLEYYIDYNMELIFAIHGDHSGCYLVDSVEPWLRLFSAKLTYRRVPDHMMGDHNQIHGTLQSSSPDEETATYESNSLRMFGVGALWRFASQSASTYLVGMHRKTILDTGGHSYREVLWSMVEDRDNNMVVYFKFLWNQTRSDLDKAKHKHSRTIQLLSLKSIYIAELMQGEDETNFNRYKIDILSIKKSNTVFWTLPDQCRLVQNEAEKLDKFKNNNRLYLNTQIPTFADYIRSTNSYSSHYTVTHTSDDQRKPIEVLNMTETYDRNTRKGRISVGSGIEKQEIFIDGNGAKSSIYSYMGSLKECKRIATIKPLVEIGSPTSVSEGDSFDSNKLYGLAALWIQLSKRKKVSLRVANSRDQSGSRYETFSYRYVIDWSNQEDVRISSAVDIVFKSRPKLISDEQTNKGSSAPSVTYSKELVLDSIDIVPKMARRKDGIILHRTTINVESIRTEVLDEDEWMNLPEECETMASRATESSGDDFPKLTNLMLAKQQFYMRAEITSTTPLLRQESIIYTVDEWIYGRKSRIQTLGLEPNLDLMIHSDTKESFDLSRQYRCLTELPDLGSEPVNNHSKLRELWFSDGGFDIVSLADVYYAPVSLWLAAEKMIKDVKLVNSLDITPKFTGDTKLDILEREIKTNIWRVSSPESVKRPWSYDMHFQKFTHKDESTSNGSTSEWFVLSKLEIIETESKSATRTTEIDIINYKYKHSISDILDKFLLPEGHGCKRNQLAKEKLGNITDDLLFDRNHFHKFFYKTSLEISESFPDVDLLSPLDIARTNHPTISGTFIRIPRSDDLVQLDAFAHYSRVHYIDGTVIATKIVYDYERSLLYQIDRLTGFCRLDYGTTGSEWKVEFRAQNRVDEITINQQMFDLLFIRTSEQNYGVLNRYKKDNLLVTVYEHDYDNFQLTEQISGPATIVRRYEDSSEGRTTLLTRGDSGYLGQERIKFYDTVSVKVLIFNCDRSKLVARFNINMQVSLNVGLVNAIRDINVAQCYNRGNPLLDRQIEMFAFEYEAESIINSTSWFHIGDESEIGQEFYRVLLKSSQVFPHQLTDGPRVVFDEENSRRVKIYFNLMSPPTAIEYYERKVGARMTNELQAEAIMKVLPSINHCSRWCDQVGCLVVSYCADHTCRLIIRNNMVESNQQQGHDSLYLSQSIQDDSCSYYYLSRGKPAISLERFVSNMDTIVNSDRNQIDLRKLTLFFNGLKATPLHFYEFKSLLKQTEVDSSGPSTSGSSFTRDNNFAFKVLKYNHLIDSAKLQCRTDKLTKITSSIYQSTSQAACLEKCKEFSCNILSFCKQNNLCIQISSGDQIDLKSLSKELIVPEQTKTLGCSVIVRNLLDDYLRFDNTSMPASFERKLDGYSALECASACDLASAQGMNKMDCLSFDLCSYRPKLNFSTQNEWPMDNTWNSICYLQKQHILLDSFDVSILRANRRNFVDSDTGDQRFNPNNEVVVCEHYSKHILSGFDVILSKQFIQHPGKQEIRLDLSAENCAIHCQQQELKCWAFQHCSSTGSQSCYIKILSPVESRTKEVTAHILAKQLEASTNCSIYVTRNNIEQYKFDIKSRTVSLLIEQTSKIITKYSVTLLELSIKLGSLVVTIASGALLHMFIIKLIGRPIIFTN